MRIGIEAQRIFRPKKHGMDIVALETIKALQRIDTQNEYFIFVKPDSDRQCLRQSNNFKIIEIPAYSYVDWEQWQLPKYVQKYQLDVLHCTSNTAPLKLNIPLVITLHDIIYLEQVSFKGTWYQNLGNLYRRWIVPKIAKKCEKIITVSEFEQKRMLELMGLPAEKVKVIYNAVSARFRVSRNEQLIEDIRIRYRLPENYIFFLGNQAPKKNMTHVLKAYGYYFQSQKKPMPLVIAETSPEQLESHLKALHLEHLQASISLTGYVNHKDLPLIYQLSSLFLYPSLRESFGIPIIEAMACGTPVITSNTSSMPEVAGGAAILVDPNKPEEIALKISDILSDPSKQAQLSALGLKRAQVFTWENTAQEVYNIYENIAWVNTPSETALDLK
ncbi:MAG: glycosyltransferase family 1 protein [Microscillaceae bacterium]|nr:glycosyltransferase family 1 protein [Microscillaceae bacterium]